VSSKPAPFISIGQFGNPDETHALFLFAQFDTQPAGFLRPRRGAALCDVASRYADCMSALTFNVVYEDAGEGWVYAHVPELPEVHTQGADLDDARAMVKDAITLVLDERRARGEAIPSMGWALVEAVEIAA
jgi:predicted RNase H-like HicB family nuclease